MADFTSTLTEGQAMDVIVRGVTREVRTESTRTLAYCQDATKLRGFSVRKLANKAEDLGKIANSDSYQSNVSNANGIMGLFDYDVKAFELFLNGREAVEASEGVEAVEAVEPSPIKSLSALYKAFRALFTEPKAPKARPEAGPKTADGEAAETAQVDVVIAALAFLTPAERHMVVEACCVLGVELPDEVEEAVAA
jgi:hypothetical protein